MLRIALYGQPAQAHNYLDIITCSDKFILSGIRSENENADYPANLLEDPVMIFENDEDMFSCSDAVLFINFKLSQYPVLKKALKKSRHVFINPVHFLPPDILADIQKLGEEAGTLFYLTHKSLNRELKEYLRSVYSGDAEFIDMYRYAPAGSEKISSSIHEIISKEIMFLYSLTKYEIKKIHITTVPYSSRTPYIINIRFELTNSSMVNLTINFYTNSNTRFTELYYGKKMLRINSEENRIEFVNRESGNYDLIRKDFKLEDEAKISTEIESFLNFLSEEKYPAEFKDTGLSEHHTISGIIKEIFEHKTADRKE